MHLYPVSAKSSNSNAGILLALATCSTPRKYNEAQGIRGVSFPHLQNRRKTGWTAAQGGSRTEGIAIPSIIRCRRFIDRRFEEDLQPMANANPADLKAKEEAHWAKTSRLMFTHLGIWFFFGFVIHMFVKPLNNIVIPILGFPLGFYMAAQGSLIVFVVMLFMFAKQQDKIDREFGFAEED
ncbi:DUF4212 domain-containing protein [Bradyrhizobium sp. 200]|uniref:DUF4212 domain-containing protein n=1 Tax=Bradyrhizobium sp. 200 TaxID=2782665 RepID=UPI001FFE7D17|nr:DUF4212 domain-containing protein [Bradyrhizobium sp. 200]